MAEESKKAVGTGAMVLIGCGVFGALGMAAIGILAAIAVPNFISMQYKAKRSEIPVNLKSIKTSQIQYESDFDVYVRVAPYPSTPTKTTQQWVKNRSGGFVTLNWAPDGDVRGSYWVDIAPNGQNFTATGISDVDGDGVYATYIATKSESPNTPITPANVY